MLLHDVRLAPHLAQNLLRAMLLAPQDGHRTEETLILSRVFVILGDSFQSASVIIRPCC